MLAVVLVGWSVIVGGTPRIVSVKFCGADEPDEFDATTVNDMGELSAFSGVPLSTGEMNCRPAGNGPLSENVGEGAPIPWKVKEPGWLTTKVAPPSLVIMGAWGCTTLTLKDCDATPPEFEALSVMKVEPRNGGLPLRMAVPVVFVEPPGTKLIPDGGWPLEMVIVGAGMPIATIWKLLNWLTAKLAVLTVENPGGTLNPAGLLVVGVPLLTTTRYWSPFISGV